MNARMRILLSTLGTISKINPGDKLIVKNKSIVIDKRWIQWYRRKIDGESRHSTILFLEELYRWKQDVEEKKLKEGDVIVNWGDD